MEEGGEVLSQLPPELQSQIYAHCSPSDLTCLACCSKKYHQTLIETLWREVELPWEKMKSFLSSKEKTKNLSYTHFLTIKRTFRIRPSGFVRIDNNKLPSPPIIMKCYKAVLFNADPCKLTRLKLMDYMVPGALITAARQLTEIVDLQISNVRNFRNDNNWVDVFRFSKLTSLVLQHCNITNSFLENMYRRLLALNLLDITGCVDIDDVGLEYISRINTLHTLSLAYLWKITDSGLVHISKISSLRNLDLHDCDVITDKGLSHVSKLMPALTELDLQGCQKITIAGLCHVFKLVQLKKLQLYDTRIVIDVDTMLKLLRMPCLTSIRIEASDAVWQNQRVVQRLKQLPHLCVCEPPYDPSWEPPDSDVDSDTSDTTSSDEEEG